MNIVMYTTHCPQCTILSKKLKQKNINFTEIDDLEIMEELDIISVPMLCVDGGALMNFKEANNWINSLEV